MPRNSLMALLLCTWVAAGSAAGPVADLGPRLVNPGYQDQPAWFKNSFLDIRDDVAEAAVAGRRLLLYFYQDGCPYCTRLLRENFADPDIVEATRRGFDVVAINLWGDREVTGFDGAAVSEKQFAAALRVQFTPTLLFLDQRGEVALRLNGFLPPQRFRAVLDYLGGNGDTATGLAARLATTAPQPARDGMRRLGAALPAPLRLADRRAAAPRHLVVLFEQRRCAACDELHDDVLRRREVAVALSNLEVAQIDIFSAERLQVPDGRVLPAREWAQELGVSYTPTLVFFDGGGREVFRTEAYLKSFHVHGAIDYVVSGAYRWQPSFQRYLQARREFLQAQGFEVDLMD